MDGNFDFYFCSIEGTSASIYLDLDLAQVQSRAAHPVLIQVRVHMRAPRQDGMSSQEEFDALIAIEDALLNAAHASGAIYAGRCTSGGFREFFFYAPAGTDVRAVAAAGMAAFPGYQFDVASADEPAWATYDNFLYPDAVGLRSMADRQVCTTLESHGDKLDVPRTLDHYAYFPTEQQRDGFVAEMLAAGFAVDSVWVTPDGRFGVHLTRSDVPGFELIDDVTTPLVNSAERHGGDYDGWGCPVVTDKPAATERPPSRIKDAFHSFFGKK